MIWTEEMIRREMEKLDRKTGLSGAKLPIRFSNGYSTLGMFHCEKSSDMWFSFSTKYYHDDNFSREEALDTIKHEYAHYMNHVLYRGTGHDRTWRKCCTDVGAVATRLYSGMFNDYYITKEKEKGNLFEKLSKYKIGSEIHHPVFGTGQITYIYGNDVDMIFDVNFYSKGTKKLTAKWIYENC